MSYAVSAPSAEELAWEVEQLRETIAELVVKVADLENGNRLREYADLTSDLRAEGYRRTFPPGMYANDQALEVRGIEADPCEHCGGKVVAEPFYRPYRDDRSSSYRLLAYCTQCHRWDEGL